MKTYLALALVAVASLASAATFSIHIKGMPTGWSPDEVLSGDVGLREQYRKLGEEGTTGNGALTIEKAGESVTYIGNLHWTHLPEEGQAPGLEGLIADTGSVSIVRRGSTSHVLVDDLLHAGTALAPIDFAILSGNFSLAQTISDAHNSEMYLNSEREPTHLYDMELKRDSNDHVIGYEVTRNYPRKQLSASLSLSDGVWTKNNFKNDGALERTTTIQEDRSTTAYVFKGISNGTRVQDRRDPILGSVNYNWSGQLPKVSELEELKNGSSGSMVLLWSITGVVSLFAANRAIRSKRSKRN